MAYQLRVELRDVSPAVWRRMLVPATLTLEDLHVVIQVAMGWQNYHLYEFEIGTRRFGIPDDEFADDRSEDAARIRLHDAGLEQDEELLYRYDFGDGWEHDLVVEQVLGSPPDVPTRARCLEGAGACPPEDCGGPYGYSQLLAALADPDQSEHAELVQWVGGDFNPALFDVAGTDAALERLR